jgi:N-dimethylarginine dimethylaminohydrolase
MTFDFGLLNEFGSLKKVALRNPAAAFVSDTKIDHEWRELNYHSRPSLADATAEYNALENLLTVAGAEIIHLPANSELTLDAIYTRDSLVVTPRGLVKPRLGKPQRRSESTVNSAALEKIGVPVLGEITGHGKVEGGDLVWLDAHTLLAGIGYRTNTEGVRQLQKLVGTDVSVISFDLPYYKGSSDVFHLMSVVSPVDHDLAVVYPPLMPVRLVEFLDERGMTFIEVPDAEFPTMGCNVLAVAPRIAIMVEGNPETASRMQRAGVKLHVYKGAEISRKGEGGPTCLTRPLQRL